MSPRLPLSLAAIALLLGCPGTPPPAGPGAAPGTTTSTSPSPGTPPASPAAGGTGNVPAPAAGASALPGGFAAPTAKPGERITIPGTPATTYRVAEAPAAEDQPYVAILSQKLAKATFDPALARAARAYLAVTATKRDNLDADGLIAFLADWAGAQGFSGYYLLSWSGSDHEAKLGEYLNRWFGSDGADRSIGIGHAQRDGIHWYALPFREGSGSFIADFPRVAAAGTTATLRFRVPANHTAFWGLTMSAEGEPRRFPVTVNGETGEAQVPFGPEPGPQRVEILADGPMGSTVVDLFGTHVGEAPTAFQPETPPDESAIRAVADAERFAVDIVNGLRARKGLPPLIADPKLADIARSHTADMQANHFIAHNSPTTGTPGNRLTKGGYKHSAVYENIGLGGSVYSCQMGLWNSPGHRIPILSTAVTRIGIGIHLERDAQGKITRCLLTENFAQPAP